MALNSGLSDGARARLNGRQNLKAAGPSRIFKGHHHVAADYGFVFLGPDIGTVQFKGKAIGPGNTDTIYRRLEHVELPDLNVPETIPIELVALSVHSIEPVVIAGEPHDMLISLTDGARSFGDMSVEQEFLDDGSGIPHGLFHTNIHINFTCHFTPVGSDKEAKNLAVSSSVYIATIRPGTWSFNPWPEAVVTNDAGMETTNFFFTGSIYMLSNDLGAGGSKRGASIEN